MLSEKFVSRHLFTLPMDWTDLQIAEFDAGMMREPVSEFQQSENADIGRNSDGDVDLSMFDDGFQPYYGSNRRRKAG
jgi:hypothetical protein